MLRPINKVFLDRLRSDTVIPLMYEPWELRKADIDIAECRKRNIWVCGTNESDSRLQTMKYIGYIVLFFLLKNKKTPFSCNILLLGDNKFGGAISEVLINNNFNYKWIKDYKKILKIENYNVIVTADHTNPDLLIGKNGLIRSNKIAKNVLIIHISGNVDFTEIKCQTIPEKPAHFGHMSFTTDFIDPKAVIDLHVAGLKVAEGMNKAKFMNLSANDLKCFLETDYPGLIDNLPLCPNIN